MFKTLRFIAITLTLCLTLTMAHSAQAKDLNDKEAAHLKQMFEGLVSYFESASNPQMSYNFDGEVESERTATHYAITLPYLTLKQADGYQTKVGIILFNVKPGEEDGTWNLAFSLPTPIVSEDAQGNKIFHTSFGNQTNYAIWDENKKILLKQESKLEDIQIENLLTGAITNAATLSVRRNVSEQEDGIFSGPTLISLTNFENRNPAQQNTAATIGEINIHLQEQGFNPENFFKNQPLLQEKLSKAVSEGTPPQEYLLAILENARETVNGLKAGIEYKDFTIHTPIPADAINIKPQDGQIATIKTFHTDRVHFDYAIEDLGHPLSKLSLLIGLNGLNLPLIENSEQTLPRDIKIRIKLDNVPTEKLIAFAKENASENSTINGLNKINLLTRLPQILSEAGTTLEIDDNYLRAKDYALELDGQFKTTPEVQNIVNGNLEIDMIGLEKFSKALEDSLAATPKPQQEDMLRKLLLQLTVIKGLAKTETKEDGETIHSYDLKIEPDGKIMLNSMDLSLLMMLLQQQQKIQ